LQESPIHNPTVSTDASDCPQRGQSLARIARRPLPLMLLASLVLLTAGCRNEGATAGQTQRSGIVGLVHRGPSCPVEQEAVPCPPRPTEANVEIRRPDGTLVATVRSGPDGRFRVPLAPGLYVLQAIPEEFGISKPVEVRVTEGDVTDVTVTIDTGVREGLP
jgi:Carboxypeptidase regulatory-like domain